MARSLIAAGFVVAVAASQVAGQESPKSRADELRSDIAKLRAAIGVLTKQLEALEKELAAVEPRLYTPTRSAPYVPSYRLAPPPGLRFPVDVERAMMGEAAPPTRQLRLQPGETKTLPAPKK